MTPEKAIWALLLLLPLNTKFLFRNGDGCSKMATNNFDLESEKY
jgi:hypothetical protein